MYKHFKIWDDFELDLITINQKYIWTEINLIFHHSNTLGPAYNEQLNSQKRARYKRYYL